MKTPQDIIPKEEFLTYTLLGFPANVGILNKHLLAKLKIDPSYELWVPFKYYRSPRDPESTNLFLNPTNIFINNKGDIVSHRENPPRLLNKRIVKEYLVSSYGFDGNESNVLIHRALACCFIPVPDKLSNWAYSKLHVNHIDGVKINIPLTNLEWTTPSGNILHAFATGLNKALKAENSISTKPVKGVVTSGKFKGYSFILFGAEECHKYGFKSTHIRKCCRGRGKSHFSCTWSFANEDEINNLPRGLKDEIITSLKEQNPKVKSIIIATDLTTGKEIIIKNGNLELIKLGFTPQNVYLVINGKNKYHKNHVFKRIPL